jgi:hypothetical protein
MVPLPPSYNLFATNCAKEVISAAVPLEEGLSVLANDLDRHLQVRNIKHQTQFDKLSAIARKCAENALAYHLENIKNYNYYHPYPLFELTHSRALSIHQNHPMDSLTSHCGF